jgi:hypothetical protein
MEGPLVVAFGEPPAAHAARPSRLEEVAEAVRRLGLLGSSPTLVVVGGAGGLDADGLEALRPLFARGLAPVAQALGAAVVDGGTDSGVMRLMGQARAATGGTFPLVGVAPARLVAPPDDPAAAEDTVRLEPHHTHFVLVPGAAWGDESPWLAAVATALAGGAPSVTVLVNGGEIAWKDVAENVRRGRPVLAVDGTGGTADVLAGAVRGQPTEPRAAALAASGSMRVVERHGGPAALAAEVEHALARGG